MRCVSNPKERMNDNNNFILSGKYEILKPLGCGSNGTVYLARHQSLGIDRAIKFFPKNAAQSPFAISEAQVLKTVQHPGIPTIYDFEEDESFYYLVEEYIQGDSLEQFLLHQPSISRVLFYKFFSIIYYQLWKRLQSLRECGFFRTGADACRSAYSRLRYLQYRLHDQLSAATHRRISGPKNPTDYPKNPICRTERPISNGSTIMYCLSGYKW